MITNVVIKRVHVEIHALAQSVYSYSCDYLFLSFCYIDKICFGYLLGDSHIRIVMNHTFLLPAWYAKGRYFAAS